MAVVEPVGLAGPAGLDEMYRDHAPALVELCRRRLGDPSRAEDACHETLIRAHRAIGSFRPGAPMWPWLATIARNVCTDIHRRESRVTLVADPDVPATTTGPEEVAAQAVRRELLAEALASLPPHYRRSVYLRHVEGWSYEEIARADRASLAAVRTRLARGRRALRERVEELARRRGEWPLHVLGPLAWLRGRATRARLALGQLENGLGPVLSGAGPFAAALVAAGSLTAGSQPVAVPAPAVPIVATAHAPRPAGAAPVAAAAVVSRLTRDTRSAQPAPARPPGSTTGVPTATPPVRSADAVPGDPWPVSFGGAGLYCHGAEHGGPVTAVACAGVASLTP